MSTVVKTCAALLLGSLLASGCSSSNSSSNSSAEKTTSPSAGFSDLQATDCPNREGALCLGRLRAGTSYTTQLFTPDLTYQVPEEGWRNYEDTPGNFLLVPPGNSLPGVNAGTSDFIGVYTSVAPTRFSRLRGCVTALVPHISSTPSAMAAWLAAQRDLLASHPAPVNVGGLEGLEVDVAARPGATLPTCHVEGKDVTVALLLRGVPPSDLEHGLIPRMTMRLYFLSFQGGVLAIELDDIDKAPGTLADLSPVAEGFRFGS